jgi:hypothetical protein
MEIAIGMKIRFPSRSTIPEKINAISRVRIFKKNFQ